MTLAPGLRHELHYRVTEARTVPALYPESPEFAAMPAVFATGYLVGLLEWACMQAVHPRLGAGEQTLGTHIAVSHAAPTCPGETLCVSVVLRQVEGRRLVFDVEARGELGVVGTGTHERCVILRERFDAKLARRPAG